MLSSLRKNGLTSLFKEVRVFKVSVKKGVFSEKAGGNSLNQGLVCISTGKAIQ